MRSSPITIIVLAGQRAGTTNALAAEAGVSHKCFVPLRGRPLLDYVLDTVTQPPGVREILVSIEQEAHGGVERIAAAYAARGIPIAPVASRESLFESVRAAAGGSPGPFIVTTADNVLVTLAAIEEIAAALTRNRLVFALAERKDVLNAHPEGQRNFYRFRDGEFANCNIYGVADREALQAGTEIFRGGGQFMKSVWRTIRAFGPLNVLLFLLGQARSADIARGVGRRFGMAATAVRFADGSLAIDVDNERTFRVCEEILAKRDDLSAIAQAETKYWTVG